MLKGHQGPSNLHREGEGGGGGGVRLLIPDLRGRILWQEQHAQVDGSNP